MPINKDLVDLEDLFEPSMFKQGGTFEDVPLNHYIRLAIPGTTDTFLVNAGFLLNQFMLRRSLGYASLKEMLKIAKEKLASYPPETSDSELQEASTGN